MNRDEPFAGLEPAGLWAHFSDITRIARPSGQEAAISRHILSWADRLGYSAKQDAAGNLCVYIPPTPGAPASPPIALQAHLDMVCVREEGSPSDPARGEILVARDGEWLMANGSTLGADNGIAIAAMMHLAESPGEHHGPLELVFTVLEETTSGGADALDLSLVRSKVMLNLDSENEGVLVVGSAGGIWSVVRWSAPLGTQPEGWSVVEVALSGAQGGHSGSDIAKHRLNAIWGLLRLLEKAADEVAFSMCALEGGDAFNAIPRSARAVLSVAEEDSGRLREAIAGTQNDLAREFLASEPGLTVRVQAPGDDPSSGYSLADSRRLIDMLTVIPCGILAMDRRFPELVATSSNTGVVSMDGATIVVECFSRSSTAPALHEAVDRIRAAARLGGAEFAVVPPEGPCWEVDPGSRALAAAQATYRRLFGAEPQVLAVHGFLECALIKKQIPGLDIISIGPEIRDAHKPGERVRVGSVGRFYRFLSELVSDYARGAWPQQSAPSPSDVEKQAPRGQSLSP